MADHFQIIGHRGAAGIAPENTLTSVRKAIALGADGVEVDVRLVGGRPVVFHDPTLERLTGSVDPLDALSFEELRKLDVGAGERIPTLAEVIGEVAGRALLNIELKTRDTAGPAEDLIHASLRGGVWEGDQFLISSFSYDFLEEIEDPELRIGCLFRGDLWKSCSEAARRLNAYSVHPHAPAVTAEIVDEAHGNGWKVFPFTVNSLGEGRRLKGLGVDGLFTDFPDRLLELRDERRDG